MHIPAHPNGTVHAITLATVEVGSFTKGKSVQARRFGGRRAPPKRGFMKTVRSLAIILFAVTGLAAGAWAQDYPQGSNGEAAPSLGEPAPKSEGPAPEVARISLIHGDVSTQRGDSEDWGNTSINAPMVRGDQVATGQDSRTEIQLDYANILRLAAHSQAKIADLTRTRIQVQVGQGYASYTMLKGSEAEVEIDSPNVAVHPLRQGRYRVQVNSDSETDVIVREGEAEITTPQGSTRVRAGEMITVRGTDQPEYKVSSAPEKDDWDGWNSDRDHLIRESLSVGHTNRYYTGVNDLDGHGHWVYVPGYGNVWQPYQEATWAPYQTGRWVYEPYYGWTWVSYEPWGWAPYHYGRWFYYENSWCWWPGPAYVGYRPLWSPAFVFFVGFGHRSGFGFGNIGWFPVGPHDPFYPWYGRGFNRVNVVNITNITVINGGRRGEFIAPLAVRGRQPYYSNAHLALTNPHVRGSITSVSAENFGHGGNTGWRHGVEEHELRESKVMTANLPVVPSRESLHSGNGNAGAPAGIQTRNSDRFFTKHAPPAATQESFHDRAARVQRVVGPEAAGASNHGNSNGGVNVRTGNTEGPKSGGAASNPNTGRMSPGGNESAAQNNTHGSNGGPGVSAGSNVAQDHQHGGWNKFGPPTSRSGGDVGNGHSESSQSNARSSSGADRQGNDRQMNDRQSTSGPQSSDRNTGQPSHTSQNNGGWQKFPSGGDHGPSAGSSSGNRNDHAAQGGSGGNSKPPLELHRPIVTPREQPGSEPRNSSPAPRNEPRYNPAPQRSEPHGSPSPSRSEPHQSRDNGGRSGASSHSDSGSHGGGGGHSDSKSSDHRR
jgi:hypothetical protein